MSCVPRERQRLYPEAAGAYIAAVQAGPADIRAFERLVAMALAHRDAVAAAVPEYLMTIRELALLVKSSGGFDPGADPGY